MTDPLGGVLGAIHSDLKDKSFAAVSEPLSAIKYETFDAFVLVFLLLAEHD